MVVVTLRGAAAAASVESMVVPFPPRRKRCDNTSTTANVTGIDQDGDEGGQRHAADHHGPQDLPGDGAGAAGVHSGMQPKMKAKRRHHDGSQPEFAPRQCRFVDGPPLLVVLDSELDDQDGVLRGQADEHDQPDLA